MTNHYIPQLSTIKEVIKHLMLDEGYLRLVVFGDSNSKRSVSNVVQVIVE